MYEYRLPNGELVYDDARHRYYWNGERIPSVTGLVKALSNTDALMGWVGKECRLYLEENAEQLDTSDTVAIKEFGRDMARSWRRYRDRAADIGTLVHQFLERWMHAHYLARDYPELPDNERAARACLGFVDWASGHDIVVRGLEQKVLHTANSSGLWPFAGTFDADLLIDGRRTLCDWKTSNRINAEMGAQLGGYDIALSEMYPDRVYESHAIIRCDRETGDIEVWKTDATELNRMAFRACFQLYHFSQKWRPQK